MPIHHQYFGSPATSFIFKYSLGIPTGDIHCGMRALTSDLFRKLPFTELGWEYATEMIVSARNIGARICEVPIEFFKEPAGRLSHHKRNGWLSPFKAGWGTLRVTASFSLDRLLVLPGTALALLGLALNFLLLVLTPSNLQNLGLGNISSSIFTAITLIGFLFAGLGLTSHFIYYPEGKATKQFSNQRVVEMLFSTFVVIAFIVFSSSVVLFEKWKQGVFSNISMAGNLRYVGVFNVSISFFIGVGVLLMCAYLAGYMEKLRASRDRTQS
jgi:hypothetical protein